MAVELPKDAEGREIPLDTEILYDETGNEYEVYHYKYPVRRTIPRRKWQVVIMDYIVHDVSDLYLTPPDSWEKPPEDLKAVEDYGNSSHLDNPTRRNLPNGYRSSHCSRCGYKASTYGDSDCDPEDFTYCPECRAGVVEDGH